MAIVIPDDDSAPGTHVLVIGVSAYRHLADGKEPTEVGISTSMRQLRSAARSASDIAEWFQNRKAPSLPPLRSLRIFLSPSPSDSIATQYAGLNDLAATRANVESGLDEFWSICHKHRDNHAAVYVAGHGVQLDVNGAVLLLEDFGTTAAIRRMHGSIDLVGVHRAFNNSGAPKHQFWFVDACRQPPELARQFDNLLSGALTLDTATQGHADSSLLLLSAITGTTAYGRPGGRSLFAEALLDALQTGAAAEGPDPRSVDAWHVPVAKLLTVVPNRVSELAAAHKVDQWVQPAGMPRPAVLHVYEGPPTVALTVSIDPVEAARVSRLDIEDADMRIVATTSEWPATAAVKAGVCAIRISTQSPYRPFNKYVPVAPPATRVDAKVQS
jgi:hypothetical protein